MNVRIRFSKTGALVYIGHLDVMRYFQKLLKRAGIDVAYSEGFSPHQLLSFTPPLPLGMESFGEYADVRLTGSVSSHEALSRLKAQSVPEIDIMSFKMLPEGTENAMAAVRSAEYEVRLPDNMTKATAAAIEDFMGRVCVNVIKKTKKSEKEVNIRPLVHSLTFDKIKGSINMVISSGSTDNLKPELVLSALFERDMDRAGLIDTDIKRIDQYTFKDDRFVSLDGIGTII
ncbi:MAG: TIGR03936 family radical SAM-associated protein [Lachnospiraceae bacterium]|nr:TIGR03936 family radical SAM-associated protein [Lachnospiraceae bacterium]